MLLTWEPEATTEQVDAVLEGLAALPTVIADIRSYRLDTDVGLAEGNADLAVVADFDDAAGWKTYRHHPAHVAVLHERIAPILAARTALQHEL